MLPDQLPAIRRVICRMRVPRQWRDEPFGSASLDYASLGYARDKRDKRDRQDRPVG